MGAHPFACSFVDKRNERVRSIFEHSATALSIPHDPFPVGLNDIPHRTRMGLGT